MNKILDLFSQEYVLALFKKELLPLYKEYEDISEVVIKPYKKMIWTTTYHVVISFETTFVKSDKSSEKLLIVCSAHSNEERENVFKAMSYLWERNFNEDYIDIPRPLFYSEYFRGTFYEGVKGENLMHYIKKQDKVETESMVLLSAAMFAKLHKMKVGPEANFNPKNSRIRTVVPGVDNILKEMSVRFSGEFDKSLKAIYEHLIINEERFLNSSNFNLCLIHGDAHTENVIHTGAGRIGLIDFTDFCLGDPVRDVATFMQQSEYKIRACYGDSQFAQEMSALFFKKYLEYSGLEDSPYVRERMTLYYNWTAIRTAVYLFLKHDNNPAGAKILLEQAKESLQL